jgi:hypothetical protein
LKVIQDYFAGILPENGTVCPTDFDYFPDPAAGRIAGAFEDEDSAIAAGARAMAEFFRRW